MGNVTAKLVKTLLPLLIATLTVLGLTTAAHAGGTAQAVGTAQVVGTVATAQPPCGDTASYDVVPLSSLPPEATDTTELIEQGGPFPYPQDGTVFQNREDLLPDCAVGYYHEFTVQTPGSPNRGARRIVTGDAGEHFYTPDHYESFVLVG
ncbi:MAG: ribonuclease [Pseudonocardiaceae bacterium]|nr:ribonuclease [Pseudonocardiaceae bacterium]